MQVMNGVEVTLKVSKYELNCGKTALIKNYSYELQHISVHKMEWLSSY